MKKETREYNFDWMLWTVIQSASNSLDGSVKEYESLKGVIPNFRNILHAILRHGETGVLFMKMTAEYLTDIMTAKQQGKKICLGTFVAAKHLFFSFDNVVPVWAEIMTVLGTFAMRKGTSEYMDYCCEVGFTETSCSAQRGSFGAYLAGLTEKPDFLVCGAPGICDTNANAVQFLSSYLDLPMFQLNFPARLTGTRIDDYHRKDYKALIRFIEEQSGSSLNEARLRVLLEEQKRQDELTVELFDLMRLKPCPVPPIFTLFIYAGRLAMPGRKSYTAVLESMLAVVRENAAKGHAGTTSKKECARLLMCYIDHYTTDARFWEWIDSQDISLLPTLIFNFWHDGINYAEGRQEETYHIDTSNLDAMIDSLADINSRMPMVKQLRGPYDAPGMWRDDLLFMAKIMKPDFLVYIGSMGCRNSWGANKLIQRDCEREGLPTMLLFADAFDDRVASWEHCVDKISEFMHVRGVM
ncbi:MAG: 2-hydroxyacyl-CoA dehydratase family protein [Desulfomonilia bacterium]|nr:2-hydroxyacyl-CoA dehydratase family protein [Desulfomonilia bacterium]